MKSRWTIPTCIALTVIAAVSLAPRPASAMDADELIAKHLDASGGLAKLRGVQSERVTGTYLTQGIEIPFTMLQKRPDRLRIDATIMGVHTIQCYDGKEAWQINPLAGSSDPRPMLPAETRKLKTQADLDGIFVDWQKKGYQADLLGEDGVDGTPAYRLRMDLGDHMTMLFWFDKSSYLILKQATIFDIDGNPIETDSFPSDYRDVDGMMTAFTVVTKRGADVINRVSIGSLEYGVPVPDEVFVKPAPGEQPAPVPAPADSAR